MQSAQKVLHDAVTFKLREALVTQFKKLKFIHTNAVYTAIDDTQ